MDDAIDLACDEFEREWAAGGRPRIEEALAALPAELRNSALRELLAVEIDFRRQLGEQPSPEDYCDRFPAHSAEIARDFDDYRTVSPSNSAEIHADTGIAGGAHASLDTVSMARSSPADAAQDMPPSLGNYDLLARLGGGGMGVVYKARHRKMKRLVALKTLRPEITRDSDAVRRFEREIEAVSKLSHPNIITAHDADESGGVHYFVMEYVEGEDLGALAKRLNGIPIATAIDYVIQAARGLSYAHRQGVIHRDIKPSNLLLTPDGTIKVLDLGLARLNEPSSAGSPAADSDLLTASGAIMGTVDFMSPEQAANTRNADARSDVYSLGCTLYYLITGRSPYHGDTLMERLLAHRDQAIPQLAEYCESVPAGLQSVFARMVAKRADERCQSMDEVLAALEAVRDTARTTGADSAKAQPVPTADAKYETASLDAELSRQTGSLPGRSKDLHPDTSSKTPRDPGWSDPRWASTVSLGTTRPRARRLLPGLLGVAVLLIAVGLGAFWRPWQQGPSGDVVATSQSPRGVEVVRFDVARMKRGGSTAGVLGKELESASPDDDVRVNVEFAEPAYAMLIALNPNGTVQVCHPDSESATPQKVREIRFPADSALGYGLTDGAGLQGFMVVASKEPLPAFETWKDQHQQILAKWSHTSTAGVWKFDGKRTERVEPEFRARGTVRPLESPEPFVELCSELAMEDAGERVEAVAFPVREN